MRLILAAFVAFGVGLAAAHLTTPTAHADSSQRFYPVPVHPDVVDRDNRAGPCVRVRSRQLGIASQLAYDMASSGAYADLDDEAFAGFAASVAVRLIESAYPPDMPRPLDP